MRKRAVTLGLVSHGVLCHLAAVDAEERLQKLEDRIPRLAKYAFRRARKKVQASGQDYLMAEAGVIYRVSPDGSRVAIKHIRPPTRVAIGTKFRLA